MAELMAYSLKQCLRCGASIEKPGTYSAAQWEQRRFCSNACSWKSRQKTVLVNKHDGRALVFARDGSRVFWARIIMQDMRGGEPLPAGSVVHHVNGDCSDDRPSNLRLYASHAEHMAECHPRNGTVATFTVEQRQRFAAKVTPETIARAREQHRASGLPATRFARENAATFGLSPSALSKALRRLTWTNVP